MMMDDEILPDFDFCGYSGYSTTTTTATTTTTSSSDDDHAAAWNGSSPLVDWGFFSGDDGFGDLIDSMMEGQAANVMGLTFPASPMVVEVVDEEEEDYNPANIVEDTKGLRLVHLLMAAAEALTGLNKSRELARVILVRLKELASPRDGTNMERLAAYFTDALQALLDGAGSLHAKNLPATHHYKDDHPQADALAAFQLLQDMSPYVKFGHFTANQAILEAVTHDRRVHIVDYDIMEGIQWASLMQALISREDGLPAPHLRITALSRGGSGRRSFSSIQETGRRLTAFAASIGQPFSFHQCRLDSDETFKPSALKLVRGEALIINCMLHLPHFNYRSPDSIASFLSGAATLSPRLVTLVEEELAPARDGGFVDRFMDTLHHYSALYDSLEAGFPMQDQARTLVERVFLGPKISVAITRSYRSRGEEYGWSWGEWLPENAGFRPKTISFANRCQAKLLLGLFNDGYRVEEIGNHKLVLGWKSRRLLSASVWTSADSDL